MFNNQIPSRMSSNVHIPEFSTSFHNFVRSREMYKILKLNVENRIYPCQSAGAVGQC